MIDAATYGQLFTRLRSPLVAYFYKRTSNRQTAEDLTQETLARVWQARDTYRAISTVEAWVMTIAHNLCIDWRRRQPKVIIVSLDALIVQCDDEYKTRPVYMDCIATHADALDGADLQIDLERDWQRLTPEQASALSLAAQGYGQASGSQRLGITGPTYSTRVHRARKALRRTEARA